MLLLTLAPALMAQTPAPAPSIGVEAEKAVQALANEVRRGDIEATVKKMYPRWKKRLAERAGGMDKLEVTLKAATQQFKNSGITIESYKSLPAKQIFEVWPGKAKKMVNGKEEEMMIKTQWLALVPTEAVYRVVDPKSGLVKRVQVLGFQIAIRKKVEKTWSFIDGSSTKVTDLRSLFPSLPKKLVLPKRGGKELK